MKKFIPTFLVICLVISLFASCTARANENSEPTIIATVTPTEIPTEPIAEPTVLETEPVIEETTPSVDEVPKYNQLEYTCPFGNVILASNGKQATVQNSGCGITCLAMVATYLLDDPTLTPDVLAEQFGKYNTKCGSAWSLFIDSAEMLGLGEVKQVHDWSQGVEEALRNGSLVISNQRGGVFTQGGHYILLTGITEDGKVMVHDPNGANWTRPDMVDGFENGFKRTAVSCTSSAYWIYTPKNSN